MISRQRCSILTLKIAWRKGFCFRKDSKLKAMRVGQEKRPMLNCIDPFLIDTDSHAYTSPRVPIAY